MEILISNISEVIGSKLTMYQRGLLFTILLNKNPDPRFTWTAVKDDINLKEAKPHLVELHEKGYIKWRGYKTAKRSLENQAVTPEVIEAITFMNNLYGRKFDYNSDTTTKNLRNRLKEQDLETIKKVIANRYSDWKDDPIMCKHLNPTTIFRPSKFPKYLEEALRTREGESFVSAEKLNLKDGDMITIDIVDEFVDDDVYDIKTYQCDSSGNKRGNGMKARRYGRDIKRMVKLQDNLSRQGLQEYVYQYKSK